MSNINDKVLAWFGMGSIGFPMCHGLFKKGYKVTLPTYRRDIDQSCGFSTLVPDEKSKTAAIDEMLGSTCFEGDSVLDMVKKSDVFLISMPTSVQVEELVLGEDGILKNGKPGDIVIDLTSADPLSTQKLSKMLDEKGIEMIDACVSGGIAGAINQTLTIMVGGKEEVYKECLPVLETIGAPEKIVYVGPSGSGDTIKCINNFLSACCTAATTEALMVATKAGIDPEKAAEIISTSGGKNDASMNKYPNLIFPGKDFNFTLNLMCKDVNLFNQTARAFNVPAFISNATYQLWKIPVAEKGGNSDCLELVKMFDRWCGTDLVGYSKK